MTSNFGPGFGLIFDQMQANWIPEPASLDCWLLRVC